MDGTHHPPAFHLAQEKEIERLKDAQTRRHSSSTPSDDYKTKWEEAEAQCRRWEKKFQQLEDETIKPLQEKVDQLQRDYNQMKVRCISRFGIVFATLRSDCSRSHRRNLFFATIDRCTI